MADPLVSLEQIRAVLIQDDDTDDEVLLDHIRRRHNRIEVALGFDYPRDVQTRRLNASDDPVLILPGPGALNIISVVEDGTTLDAADYELEPGGRTLLRLDSESKPQDWIAGDRMVVVTFTPQRAPEALIDAEIIEVVRSFRGAQAGYADRIGVDGESSIPYSHSLSKDTRDLIADLKKGDGIGIW